MNFTKNQMIIIFAAVFVVIVIILIFVGVLPGRKQAGEGGGLGNIGGGQQAEITFWGVEEDQFIRPIIEAYGQVNKAVRISYTQFSESDYERNLINALANGRGPDILMIHNTWLPKHFGKVYPLPATAGFSITQMRQLFPQVVEADFTDGATIYALPTYIDTLAFLYNKDFFDTKGIAVLPKTWNEFQYVVPRLRILDFSGKISQAAAAIGGSERSIYKASDLLNLVMLQSGTQMLDESGRAAFARSGGEEALNFYLQFANPNSSAYTWSDNLRNSLDFFSQGGVGAIFNYQSAIAPIKARNPYLNLEVAPMMQLNANQPINYADYWGLTVSNQSKDPATAWNFIMYFATDPSIAEKYLTESKRPPALRSLIQKYLNDPDLGVFARQALTARSWPQPDSAAIKQIFSNMIELLLSGRLTINQALEQAENEVNSL